MEDVHILCVGRTCDSNDGHLMVGQTWQDIRVCILNMLHHCFDYRPMNLLDDRLNKPHQLNGIQNEKLYFAPGFAASTFPMQHGKLQVGARILPEDLSPERDCILEARDLVHLQACIKWQESMIEGLGLTIFGLVWDVRDALDARSV